MALKEKKWGSRVKFKIGDTASLNPTQLDEIRHISSAIDAFLADAHPELPALQTLLKESPEKMAGCFTRAFGEPLAGGETRMSFGLLRLKIAQSKEGIAYQLRQTFGREEAVQPMLEEAQALYWNFADSLQLSMSPPAPAAKRTAAGRF